jgi:hypothetical protein
VVIGYRILEKTEVMNEVGTPTTEQLIPDRHSEKVYREGRVRWLGEIDGLKRRRYITEDNYEIEVGPSGRLQQGYK